MSSTANVYQYNNRDVEFNQNPEGATISCSLIYKLLYIIINIVHDWILLHTETYRK